MNVLSLCSGAGGLELGIRIAVPGSSVVAFCERDACAIEVLAARMEDGSLAQAPIWFDLLTFDGRPLSGTVDLVTAGFPCQPHSLAGKRGGVDDDRWLWDHVWRVVREVRSPLLFVENVAGLLSSGGFDRVLGDLASGGWSAEWDCVPASSVGAPHIRNRVFLLAAHPDGGRRQSERVGGLLDRERATPGDDADRCARAGGEEPSDPERAGLEIGRIESHRDERAPAERDRDGWAGRPPPESTIRRMDDGVARQVDGDRLFVLGNGVVPQAAARAWRVLWGRLKNG